MNMKTPVIFAALVLASSVALAAEPGPVIVEHKMLMDHGDGHLMDMEGGMVMGQNKDKLPPGCDKVSEDAEITVHAGHKYARDFPGTMFGFDRHEWRVKPCTRLTVHFINEDHVRHQWMMHGLPKFIYDKGMFHLEMTGPAKISGTLILPAEDRTYLVHCDIAQHMEKGMKGQLIVGKGGAPFPSIPGISDLAIPDDYGPVKSAAPSPAVPKLPSQPPASPPPAEPVKGSSGAFILGIILGALGIPLLGSRLKGKCQGMTVAEVSKCTLAFVAETFTRLLDRIKGWLGRG